MTPPSHPGRGGAVVGAPLVGGAPPFNPNAAKNRKRAERRARQVVGGQVVGGTSAGSRRSRSRSASWRGRATEWNASSWWSTSAWWSNSRWSSSGDAWQAWQPAAFPPAAPASLSTLQQPSQQGLSPITAVINAAAQAAADEEAVPRRLTFEGAEPPGPQVPSDTDSDLCLLQSIGGTMPPPPRLRQRGAISFGC